MPNDQTRKDNSTESSTVGLQDFSQHDASRPIDDEDRPQDHDKAAAYRKLYGIITIMTFLLFLLNIIQVPMLPRISSLYWILLCPGIIFVAFTSWACVFIHSNRDLFYSEPWETRNDRTYAWEHFKALFTLRKRSHRSYSYDGKEPNWPIRFSRAGILLTAFLNIILCQFIYLPIFAVPAFNQIVWKMESNSSYNITTPSFAVLQDTTIPRRAPLETDNATVERLCQVKSEAHPRAFCFRDVRNMTHGESTIQYAIFDGSSHSPMKTTDALDIWYRHYSRGKDPVLSLAVFDQALADDFPRAYNCGAIASTLFPASQRVHILLQQADINDNNHALDLAEHCQETKFRHYSSYEIDVTSLGAASDPGPNKCDWDDIHQNGSCNGDLTVTFFSNFAKIYTSEHSKNWITILVDEGGVVGFVTFLTWFFGIFEI